MGKKHGGSKGAKAKALPLPAQPSKGKKPTHLRHIELNEIRKQCNAKMKIIDAEIKSEVAMDKIRSDYAAAKARVEETGAQHTAAVGAAMAKAQATIQAAATLRNDLKAQVKQLQSAPQHTDPLLDHSVNKMIAAVSKFLDRLKPKKKSQKKAAFKFPKAIEVPKNKGKKVAFLTG